MVQFGVHPYSMNAGPFQYLKMHPSSLPLKKKEGCMLRELELVLSLSLSTDRKGNCVGTGHQCEIKVYCFSVRHCLKIGNSHI